MALTDNLISHWKLDEASGDALDAHGSNTLTETSGTIDATTGKLNGARDFESGDTEYFDHASNSDLQSGDIDFSIAAWINCETLGFVQCVASKGYQDATTSEEWWLAVGSFFSNKIGFVKCSGTTRVQVASDGFGTLSTGTWYFVAAGHNASSNDIWISVNGGTPTTTSTSTGVNGSSSISFKVGSGHFQWYFDGLIDEVSWFKRDIRADLATFYNSGTPLAYPFSVGGSGSNKLHGKLGGKFFKKVA